MARLAGVSPATVSYAISGKATITEATRQRVFDAMAELDYTPNAMAQALAGQQIKILAMLFGGQQRGILNSDLEYMLGAASAARELGFHLLLWPTLDRNVDEVRAMRQSGMLAGVVLMEVRMQDERVEMLEAAGIPVALIGRTEHVTDTTMYADRDFEGAIHEAVDYLVGLGHERIAFVNGPRRVVKLRFGATVRAENAFKSAMKQHGLKVTNLYCESTIEAGAELATSLREKHPDITAIVEMNAEAIVGFMQAAAKAGIAIPKALSVVSIGTSDNFANGTVPPLTTIAPPASEMGRSAVRQLIAHLADQPHVDEQHLHKGTLVVRGSAAPAPRVNRGR